MSPPDSARVPAPSYNRCTPIRGRTSTMTIQPRASFTRMLLACVIIILGACWAGARWGQRQPIGVAALQPVASSAKGLSAADPAAREAALTDQEAIHAGRYRQASP